jgi:multidrug efflux pump subunit AcrA (membrane-fusion protein)
LNDDASLLGGMYAVARVVTSRAEQAVAVPREAVFTREGRRMVYVVSGDKVSAVPVTEGIVDAGRVQILSGVSAGQQVVADARRQVAEGVKIRPVVVN